MCIQFMESMTELLDGVHAIDLAILLPEHKTLIIADTHIGYEEALNKQGVLIPRTQNSLTVKRLDKIIKETRPEIIIINGDVKHEFGTISETEWRNTIKLIDHLARKSKKLILIKGNHDKILGPIAEKRNIEIHTHLKIDNILITHGHKEPISKQLENVKTIIIGHEHPAISLEDYPRVEKYKCFLKGTYKRKKLIVAPSFLPIVEGTDIMREKTLSPLITNLNNMEVFIVGDKVMRFGLLKDLKKM